MAVGTGAAACGRMRSTGRFTFPVAIVVLLTGSTSSGLLAQTPPPPERLTYVAPVYPEAALSGRVAGDVVIEAVIGTDGRVTSATVVRSVPVLDQAALEAVRQWEYTPTVIDGGAVSVVMTVTVSFRLDGQTSPAPDPPPQEPASIDYAALLAELQLESPLQDSAAGVLWTPPDFFLASGQVVSPVERQQLLQVLAPFVLVAVRDGTIGPFGGITFEGEDDVRASTTVLDREGRSYRPLDAADLDADVVNFTAVLQQFMRNSPAGESTHFLVFPALDADGLAIADPRREGTFTVRVDGEDFTYLLPLESLLAPRFCPVDGARLSGAWRYCPYHGVELVTNPPATEAGPVLDSPVPDAP